MKHITTSQTPIHGKMVKDKMIETHRKQRERRGCNKYNWNSHGVLSLCPAMIKYSLVITDTSLWKSCTHTYLL